MKSAYATRLKAYHLKFTSYQHISLMVKQAHQLLNALQQKGKKYTHLYAYMSGPRLDLFGFLSTPRQKCQAERSQCLMATVSGLKKTKKRIWATSSSYCEILLDALQSTIADVERSMKESRITGGKRGMDI